MRPHLRVPFDDVVGSSAQVKDRLALGIKEHSLGRHKACHHDEESSVRGPLGVMNRPILHACTAITAAIAIMRARAAQLLQSGHALTCAVACA